MTFWSTQGSAVPCRRPHRNSAIATRRSAGSLQWLGDYKSWFQVPSQHGEDVTMLHKSTNQGVTSVPPSHKPRDLLKFRCNGLSVTWHSYQVVVCHSQSCSKSSSPSRGYSVYLDEAKDWLYKGRMATAEIEQIDWQIDWQP